MENQQKTYGYGRFQFDRHILENLTNNYSHPLRLDVIKSFTKHKDLAILLYTYIDRNLAFKDNYEVGLEKLFDHLDLSQRHIKYPSGRKRVIDPVLEQIRGKPLSTGVLSHVQVLKTTDGKDYKLVCRKKSFTKRLKGQKVQVRPQPPLLTVSEPSESEEPRFELLSLLVQKGLTQKQAVGLVSKTKQEVIRAQLEYLPFRLKEYKAQGKEINEPAILYDSINDNWKIPKGYLEAEKEKERKAQRLEQERIVRLEQDERQKIEEETARTEAYKETLNPAERARLREKALEELRNTEGIREQFIGDPLISGKESEILKSEIEEGESVKRNA